jgi:hypothetical protein
MLDDVDTVHETQTNSCSSKGDNGRWKARGTVPNLEPMMEVHVHRKLGPRDEKLAEDMDDCRMLIWSITLWFLVLLASEKLKIKMK